MAQASETIDEALELSTRKVHCGGGQLARKGSSGLN